MEDYFKVGVLREVKAQGIIRIAYLVGLGLSTPFVYFSGHLSLLLREHSRWCDPKGYIATFWKQMVLPLNPQTVTSNPISGGKTKPTFHMSPKPLSFSATLPSFGFLTKKSNKQAMYTTQNGCSVPLLATSPALPFWFLRTLQAMKKAVRTSADLDSHTSIYGHTGSTVPFLEWVSFSLQNSRRKSDLVFLLDVWPDKRRNSETQNMILAFWPEQNINVGVDLMLTQSPTAGTPLFWTPPPPI